MVTFGSFPSLGHTRLAVLAVGRARAKQRFRFEFCGTQMAARRSRQRKNDQRRTKTSQKHDPELIYIGRQKDAHWPRSQGVGSAQRNEPHSATADKGEPSTTALQYARVCTVALCASACLSRRQPLTQLISHSLLPQRLTISLLPAKLIL